MTTAARETTSRTRWALPFLAALVAVLATVFGAASVSAATGAGAETRVRASQSVAQDIARPPEAIRAGQRLGNEPAGVVTAVATGVAAKALPAFPKALTGGPANVHVYYGVRDGKNVYVGITNNIGRRTTQHADRFVPRPITTEPLTRGQARAVEEALILGNPGFENKIHSISPSHSYYDDAVSWGQAWLRQNGL